MNCYHRIFALCVFVFTEHRITQGMFLDNLFGDYNYQSTPSGYHWESLSSIEENYDPTTYTIVSEDEALSMYTRAARGHKGSANKTRTKRGFFNSIQMPYLTDKYTSESTSTTTVNVAENVSAKTVSDGTAANTENTAIDTATAESQSVIAESGAEAMRMLGFGKGVKNDADTSVITDSTGVTKNSTGTVISSMTPVFIDNLGSEVSTVVSMGETFDHTLVTVGPYMPLVYKVAITVVPGLTPYQTLLLTLEVAKISGKAINNYEQGQSVASVTVGAAGDITNYYLSKRDTGATVITEEITEDATVTADSAVKGSAITDYATNIYHGLKDIFKSRIGTDSLSFFSGRKYNPPPDDKQIVHDGNDEMARFAAPDARHVGKNFEMIETKRYDVDGDGTPDIETTIVVKNFENGAELSHSPDDKIKFSEPDDNEERAGMVDPSVQVNRGYLNKIANIDKTTFDKLLKESMRYQPKFIRDLDGEVLVKHLNRKKSNKPPSANIDSDAFTALTNQMQFDESVTDEQKKKLVNLLTKCTDYFILKGIRDKKSTNIANN